jgi:hypothetical protein
MIDAIPVSLIFLAGWSGGNDSNWGLISGDALIRIQSMLFELTVIED